MTNIPGISKDKAIIGKIISRNFVIFSDLNISYHTK